MSWAWNLNGACSSRMVLVNRNSRERSAKQAVPT
jgi:hypothetical protein